jgi:hypothetical protein
VRKSVAFLACAALAGCSAGDEQRQAEQGAERIECAIGPGGEFGPDCLVEKAESDGVQLLVVRHPDGGFRRFEKLGDGRGLRVMDGSDEARLSFTDNVLEVTVGDDAYRFPANRVQADAPAD